MEAALRLFFKAVKYDKLKLKGTTEMAFLMRGKSGGTGLAARQLRSISLNLALSMVRSILLIGSTPIKLLTGFCFCEDMASFDFL